MASSKADPKPAIAQDKVPQAEPVNTTDEFIMHFGSDGKGKEFVEAVPNPNYVPPGHDDIYSRIRVRRDDRMVEYMGD